MTVVIDQRIADIVATRAKNPDRIAQSAASRTQPTSLVGSTGRLLLVAADHPARGSLGAGDDPMAMGDRSELLSRLVRALGRTGVDGVLGTADIIEDLLLLGALESKVVIGSMNRGGLAGAAFEIDDRFTAYSAASIAAAGYQGGKMLFRMDADDPATPSTMEACAAATGDLASHRLLSMIEPFISHRDANGRLVNDLSTKAVIRSAAVAAGLASTSAYTWLKLPVVDDMQTVLAATTLPVVLLGGEVSADQEAQFAAWSNALSSPQVRGMVVGRSLLFPPDSDVEAAVDATVAMMAT